MKTYEELVGADPKVSGNCRATRESQELFDLIKDQHKESLRKLIILLQEHTGQRKPRKLNLKPKVKK